MNFAIVPVAGRGTRMLPLSLSAPKESLPLGEKPVLAHVVSELAENGFGRVLLVSSRDKNFSAMDELFAQEGASVATVVQHEPRGLGDAVLQAAPFATEPFAIALGDAVLCRVENRKFAPCRVLSRMKNAFESRPCAGVVAFQTVPREQVARYGIAAPSEKLRDGEPFTLRDLVEKPSPEDAPSQLAVAARYLFAPSLFDALQNTTPGVGGEIQLTDAIRALISRGETVLGVTLAPDERRFDIGDPISYARACCEWTLRASQDNRDFARELLNEYEND